MPKPADDVSRLFRSLGTDDTQFKAANKAAAHDAEQRWPLFKAVAPQKPASAPALSDEEKQFWTSQARAEGTTRKQALSLPGLSVKLASSLDKFSGRQAPLPRAATMPAAPLRSEAPAPRPIAPLRTQPAAPTREAAQTGAAGRRPLFGRAVETGLTDPDPAPAPAVDRPSLFARKATAPLAEDSPDVAPPKRDQCLSSIFERLDEKEEPAPNAAVRRPSFLGRLGKR